jgi:hypothetical protein
LYAGLAWHRRQAARIAAQAALSMRGDIGMTIKLALMPLKGEENTTVSFMRLPCYVQALHLIQACKIDF